jgi:DNA repair protein RecN (Recombination protein N)
MLSRLDIRNYAIIEKLSIDFDKGFNIITGETGAGKSILMGALGLVLGDRADTTVLFNTSEKCVVEALFQPADKQQLKNLLEANELDADEQLMVRREIAANGKSRSFINDTPVTLQVLRQFAGQMVDLHRQFDTQDLGDDAFQRNVLDALAGNASLVQQYVAAYKSYTASALALKKLEAQQANANKELDYYRFLFEELQDAAFADNELEDAEIALELLSNAEGIKQALSAASFSLHEGDTPVTVQLKSILQQLQQLKTQPAGLEALIERLQSAYVEVKDIAEEIEALSDTIHMDAERMMQLTDRINLGNKLLKKHNVQSTAELLAIQADLDQKLQQVLHLDDHIEQLRKETSQQLKEVKKLGVELSAARKKVIASFEQALQQLLAQVGMPNARLQVQCEALQDPASHGMDEVQFLFDANKSGRLEPLEKVASGGERSRLMLGIKSLVAGGLQMPTLIFDEIDTGISGEAARQVGIIMQQLARKHQLIAITHQPQIAAKADAHFFVYKQEKNGAIKTGIRSLSDGERVDAIATMLGGNELTDASRKIAAQMMGS